MKRLVLPRIAPSYGQKLFLLATLPLILAVTAISALVADQSRALAEREIAALERQMIEAKKAELRNYVTQARNGLNYIYGMAGPDNLEARRRVKQILSAMTYGEDGFFFVYDYDGTNLVSPRQTDMINRNWWDLTDGDGRHVVRDFIDTAREGTGWVTHLWPKPATGEEALMVSYVTALHSWKWAMGTGVFIDDVLATTAAARADVEARVRRTFFYIGAITAAALIAVFASGMFLNIRERRLADAKLKELTQRVFDAQEEERGRVARELHDGISQLLVGVRYALDSARRRFDAGDARASETLDRGMTSLSDAIQEVRRISRDLRPGVLDDLGLGPALKALVVDFGARTGIETAFDTVVFRNRLDNDTKISLYRIAQEALTNVERHSGATRLSVDLRGHRNGATLRISDNGRGIAPPGAASLGASGKVARQGIGLRNMQERVDQMDGSLRIQSTRSGTVIEVQVPLSHIVDPTARTPAPGLSGAK
ncbi:histidine kinase [Pseudooceanicola sediminis]|uniref:histidine kinase n=1 Tax=Pseudooceanicola sediminis TaxID=2211117 RepID=A0A399J5T6_9RHOB|nr:cache domain-containing protein [Pseudooceanicola sediminis]KAA2316792.1 histidine kinase [Puniceibacterium sp. HSS470]RII40751.1 histidine kinase [Pseudooceanicola sediminis]|tara:strand:+ start:229132 stop:230583 length:1452 start_codon:yes stop_codon:yes gene_type:complete